MTVFGKAASPIALQAVADICFAVVECYSTKDFCTPYKIIFPLRFTTIADCETCIKLWTQDNHCVALVGSRAKPLIPHLFADAGILKAISEEE